MSKTTQDPTKYYRTGIAITLERKAIFEERLKALNLKTVGDLVTMFILAENIVEVLKPVVEKHQMDTVVRKDNRLTKRASLEVLRKMTPEELAALMALVQRKKAA